MKKKLTSRKADIVIVTGLLAAVLIPYLAGIRVPAGPSMGKTLGLAYRINKDFDPKQIRINQIIVVEEPEETRLKHWYWFFRRWVLKDTVKRIVDIRKDGLILAGDNDEKSTDSREWSAPIPWSKVRGLVVQRYPAPRTFRERITWVYPPRDQLWNSSVVAVRDKDSTRLYLGLLQQESFRGYLPKKWVESRLLMYQKIHGDPAVYRYATYDLRSRSFSANRNLRGEQTVIPRPLRAAGYTATGGIVFALDNDKKTCWSSTSVDPRISKSEIRFDRLTLIKQIRIQGFADATICLKVYVDGRLIARPAALQLTDFTIPVAKACRVVGLELERQPSTAEEFEGQITSIEF